MEKRIIEILRDGVWYNSSFEDIKHGDLFRMFDMPGNIPVLGANGSYISKATSDVYTHTHSKGSFLIINTDEVNNNDEELGIELKP